MAYIYNYLPEEEFFEVAFTGDVTLEELKRLINEIWEKIIKTGCKRILSNTLDANISLSILDFFELARYIFEFAKEKNIKLSSFKRAYVGKKGLKTLRFYETVLLNRGQNMKLFHDREEARKWLVK